MSKNRNTIKYYVSDHHDFWQHEKGNVDSIEDADIVFLWADWPYSKEIQFLKMAGKIVKCLS